MVRKEKGRASTRSCSVLPVRVDRPMRIDRAGFSQLELVLALFLAGILSAMGGYAYLQWVPRYQMERAVQHISGDMQLARMKAISENRFYRLQFSPPNDSYLLEREAVSGASRWPGVQEGLTREFRQSQNPYHCPGVRMESSSGHPVFSPRGTAAGTTIILKNPSVRKIISLSNQGRVKVQEG
jgi:Tfp pilus assembly protein FimT